MKKIFYLLLIIFCIIGCAPKKKNKMAIDFFEELKLIYTKYAEGKTAEDRLKYIYEPDKNQEIIKNYYEGKTIGYTPLEFGHCYFVNEDENCLCLEEFAEATNILGVKSKVKCFRYFRRTKNEIKIDWQATTCYNKTSLNKIAIMKDESEIQIRCVAKISDSEKSNYYCFIIGDNAKTNQLYAYAPKNENYSEKLFDLFESDERKPVVLKIKYSKSLDVFVITDFIQKDLIMKQDYGNTTLLEGTIINVLDYFPTNIGKTWNYENDNGQIVSTVTVSDMAKDDEDGSKQYLFCNALLEKYKTYTIYKCNKDEISIWVTVNVFGQENFNEKPYPICLTQPNKEWEMKIDSEEIHSLKTEKTSCKFDEQYYNDCIMVQETTLLNYKIFSTKKSYYAKNIGLVYVTLTDENGKETVFQKLKS